MAASGGREGPSHKRSGSRGISIIIKRTVYVNYLDHGSIYELQDIWYEFLSALGQSCWSYAVNSTKIETVNVLYLANFSDVPFPDGPSSVFSPLRLDRCFRLLFLNLAGSVIVLQRPRLEGCG